MVTRAKLKPVASNGDMPRPAAQSEPRRLVILGATGSIGQSTASVIEAVPGQFCVEAVAGGRDAAALAIMARRLGARHAVIADEGAYGDLREGLSGSGIEAAAGQAALRDAAVRPADLVVAAITGAAGVEPTFAAVREGRAIALANKECLVCAGHPFMQMARSRNATILPMDSEHNAIFQAMAGMDSRLISKMILTASGGPFRQWDARAIAAATPQQALAHPNWDMGPKVTVDSASLMNKGLELIEAHHLFAIEAARLDILVHPQSIVHGLVGYSDGSMVAGMANPDMRVPIANCLGWPNRLETGVSPLDLAEIGSLSFEKPDFERFPALGIAIDALRLGGAMTTVLNAANEVAVERFLAGAISFGGIARLVSRVCEGFLAAGMGNMPASVSEALAVDHNAREMARTILA